MLLAEPHIFGAPSRDQITFARYELTLFAGYLTDGPLAEKRVCSVLKREGVYRFFKIVIELIFFEITSRRKVNHSFSFVRSLSVLDNVHTNVRMYNVRSVGSRPSAKGGGRGGLKLV